MYNTYRYAVLFFYTQFFGKGRAPRFYSAMQTMQYTLYNAIGDHPQTWRNDKPLTMANGDPLVRINLSIPDEINAPSFWPWRSEQITELFNSCPPGKYSMEAWDVYCEGAFRYTEYYVHVE